MERSLVIIKPDAVCRGLAGEIIKRFETTGFNIRGLKMVHMSKEKAGEFYGIYKDKPFFRPLVKFMASAPSLVMVVEGEDAIKRVRLMIGTRIPSEAEKGTIRGDYAADGRRNIIHASDSKENAESEIKFFFKPEEIYDYKESDWLNSEPG